MHIHLKAGLFAFVTAMLPFGATAGTVSASVDRLVNDCAYSAGVRGSYHVTPVRYGSVDALSVPPGASVSKTQSQRINRCVASGLKPAPSAAPQVTRRVTTVTTTTARTRLTGTDACLAEYRHKLRTTDYGREYRGDNVGTRMFSGLFGRRMGRQLIEHEYDRCLNKVAYAQDRCPTGLFTGGAGYCVKRPF